MSSPWKQTVTKPQFDQGEIPDPDTYPARCVALLDLGTTTESFQGQPKEVRKLLIVWELVTTPNRYVVAKDYSRHLSERANLRKLIAAWRGNDLKDGEEFDYSKLLGAPCLVQIGHREGQEGRVFAQVAGVLKPPKGTTVPEATKDRRVLWSVEDGTPFPGDHWLPGFLYGETLADRVARCHEKQGKRAGGEKAPAEAKAGAEPAAVATADDNAAPF